MNVIAGECTTVSALLVQAAEIFGAGSPDYNSVRGKLENLDKQVTDGNLPEAKSRAFDIVDFVLAKEKAQDLAGTDEQVAEFASDVYCFSGLDIVVSDPSNSALIFPSDSEQVVVSADGQAGVHFPSLPVNAPTLVTFTNLGSPPLITKLDQYAGYVSITAQSEASTILTQPATVGVCAQGTIPAAVRERLRLGHGLKTAEEATDYQGFELAPSADADFLQCANEVASAPSSVAGRLWARVASLMMPKKAQAFQFAEFGGGVGGTVTEFSPFAPVDPALEFGGGVGGTVTEFIRMSTKNALPFGAALTGTPACPAIEAPIGSPVRDACLPLVRLRTRLGTIFNDVPVHWNVTLGAGTIAVRDGSTCTTFGASASDATDADGESDICWTLGVEGANQVVATPAIGGDAPPGVIFLPADRTFDATANPPSALAFLSSPGATTAGAPASATVEVRDENGDRVIGYDGPVSVGIASGPAGATLGGTSTVDANDGVASFTNLVLTMAGDYTLNATAPFLPGPANLPVSESFTVSPAAAATMVIVQGNDQTVASGSAVPISPTVRVSDAYGNVIAGLGVEWTAALSSTGSATPGISVTGAGGQASTVWTLGDGANQLRAELISNPAIFVVFDATGTSTLVTLNSCAPGGSSDPVNDVSKPFAFYLPDPGNNRTMRQIQLFFSSQGRANQPTEYRINLEIQRTTFDPAAPVARQTATALVNLRGNNSENKMVTFTLPQPIVGAAGQSAANVTVRITVPVNPDGATITFNSGPCSPGKNCKPPTGCKATEVSAPTPYPLGTFYRNSVGITVKGS